MQKRHDPIGEIDCPLCARPADVMKFGARTKLDPDGGAGKPAYERKLFIACPPVRGYTGCGTILSSSPNAQERILDKGKMFGPEGRPANAPAPAPAPAASPAPVPAPLPSKIQTRRGGILGGGRW